MSETTNITLSESQIKALRDLDETEYKFPHHRRILSCRKLEKLGLAESEMRHSSTECHKGVAYPAFARAYRLTPLGLKCQARKP